MTKHTPGPWRIAYLDHNGQSVVKGDHIEICTCWHHSVGAIEKQMHHNASLIAAAPDLLEALEALLEECPVYDCQLMEHETEAYGDAKLRAANVIAKAKGE